ncbi:MAG: methylenetetrahydrofolate reductase [Granulosicoccus sp.]|nr:methylenetetrahydrofolate reductase [Granulosicoccus sp.]
MNMADSSSPALSFEFYPPCTPAQERRLWRTVGCLETLLPDFFSMTYGAQGSEQSKSHEILARLSAESEVQVAAHLTCVGRTQDQIQVDIERFREMGISRIVALRGDVSEESEQSAENCFRFASDLVQLLSSDSSWDISVAAYPEVHPEAVNAQADLQALKTKLELGSQRAITQFFYDPQVFLHFRDQAAAAGIEQPIIPGILPVHDIEKVIRFSNRCGADVPAGIVDEFRVWHHDPEASRELALSLGLSLCETLKQEGVEHFHFYTLNQSDLSFDIARELVGVRKTAIRAA